MREYVNFTEYCTELYRSKMDEAALLEQFQQTTTQNLEQLDHHYAYVIWYILNMKPCLYFDHNIYEATVEQLISTTVTTEVLELFHTAFKNYRHLTTSIQEFSTSGFNSETKNKLYRLPTYVTLVDDCLTPLYKAIALLLDIPVSQDVTDLSNALAKNNLSLFTNSLDLSILKSIHQGNFVSFFEGKTLGFTQVMDQLVQLKSFSTAEFDQLIDSLYDTCSGILLGFAQVLTISGAHLKASELETNVKVAFDQLALKLSLPNLACINLHETNQAQLNIHMTAVESDPNFLICTAIEIATQIFEQYPGYHTYFVNFDHPRLATAFVRIKAEEIAAFLNDYSQLSHYIEQMIKRSDIQIATPSTESIDMQEIACHQFPVLNTESYCLHTIEDISITTKKRLKAQLYLGNIEDKDEIKNKITEAVNWLKQVKTVPYSKVKTKNGTMEADSVYLQVYRQDQRQNKQVSTNNENFICLAEYNQDGRSTLVNCGVSTATWNSLNKEDNGFLTLAWRDPKYHISKSRKVGRNEPCPCGSGKKYKKCHG